MYIKYIYTYIYKSYGSIELNVEYGRATRDNRRILLLYKLCYTYLRIYIAAYIYIYTHINIHTKYTYIDS